MLHDDCNWQSWAKYFSKLPQCPPPFIHELAISWAGKLVALIFDYVAQCINLALAIYLPCDVKVQQTHDMRVLYLAEFLSTFCGHCSSWVFVNGSSWPGWINTLLWHCHTVLCVLYLVSFFYIYSCAKIKIIKRQLIQFYKFDWTKVTTSSIPKKGLLEQICDVLYQMYFANAKVCCSKACLNKSVVWFWDLSPPPDCKSGVLWKQDSATRQMATG